MGTIAIVILNWNGRDMLRRFLPAVLSCSDEPGAEVWVADNGSTDGSAEMVEAEFPAVRVLRLDCNYGFAEGYNRALREVEADYAVLLNSDVEPTSGWLRPLAEYMDAHPEAAACQPKVLSYHQKDHFEYAGACGGFIDRYGYPFCRGRLFGTLETDCGQYDDPLDIFWASGAALFVRTAVYREVGGLDPGFFAHMEEIDLCWRIHLAGYRIAVVPQSRVHHQGGASLDAANPQKTYLNFRNNLLMLHKNLPRQEGKKVLFIRRLYDTLAFARFVALGQIPHARAILRAHNDFRKMRKQYTRHPQQNLLNTFPEARRNITMEYFLKGKKKF